MGTLLKRAYMGLFHYIGGLQWLFYDSSNKIETVADCAFASKGLEVVFVTNQPVYVLIFETLTGNLKYSYRTRSNLDKMKLGLESRLNSNDGVFLGYHWYS